MIRLANEAVHRRKTTKDADDHPIVPHERNTLLVPQAPLAALRASPRAFPGGLGRVGYRCV
jgi:hypothetical protein